MLEISKEKMAKIFISHSSRDKEFAIRLGTDLKEFGHVPWLDEWEIKVGECIPSKIEQGISKSDYVVIVLSLNSTNSQWVDREWKSKYWEEVNESTVMVLPVLISDCKIPKLLVTKKYADFRNNYSIGLVQLMGAISLVFQKEDSKELVSSAEHSQEISHLIGRIQSRDEVLSNCVAEALGFARKLKNRSLERLCKAELTGWYRDQGEDIDEENIPKYRLIEVFVSFARLNMQFMGWGESASNVLEYLRRDSDQFFPRKMLVSEPVSEIESKQQPIDLHKSILTIEMKLGDVVPETSTPDLSVYGYGRADSYEKVLEGLRTELTQRLLELLPSLNEEEGK